jgi:lysophospholipase L1-like esterase
VITVSPLILGEDLNKIWNREFERLSQIIEELSASYENIECIDLRMVFIPKLKGKGISEYLPKSAGRIALDTLMLRQREQIDEKSSERGLFFTLDGVHLNSTGA